MNCVSENDCLEYMDHESDPSDPDCDPTAEDLLPEPEATVDHCVCSFPKFFVVDGIHKCSRCGKDDHSKNGNCRLVLERGRGGC